MHLTVTGCLLAPPGSKRGVLPWVLAVMATEHASLRRVIHCTLRSSRLLVKVHHCSLSAMVGALNINLHSVPDF